MSDWSRRNFLRGAAGGLGMVVIPTFLTRSGNLFASPTPGIATPAKNLNATYFATSFGVDEQVIRKAMTAALSKGGEFADLFFQHQINNYVGLEDGSVNRAYSSVDLGVGVRVVVGDQTGFAFTEELTPESIIEAAKTAATIAQVAPGRSRTHSRSRDGTTTILSRRRGRRSESTRRFRSSTGSTPGSSPQTRA